jgi:hypothetical protein
MSVNWNAIVTGLSKTNYNEAEAAQLEKEIKGEEQEEFLEVEETEEAVKDLEKAKKDIYTRSDKVVADLVRVRDTFLKGLSFVNKISKDIQEEIETEWTIEKHEVGVTSNVMGAERELSIVRKRKAEAVTHLIHLVQGGAFYAAKAQEFAEARDMPGALSAIGYAEQAAEQALRWEKELIQMSEFEEHLDSRIKSLEKSENALLKVQKKLVGECELLAKDAEEDIILIKKEVRDEAVSKHAIVIETEIARIRELAQKNPAAAMQALKNTVPLISALKTEIPKTKPVAVAQAKDAKSKTQELDELLVKLTGMPFVVAKPIVRK